MLILLVIGIVGSFASAQANPWIGTWSAAAPDQGVVVRLTLGASNTLVIPGTGPDKEVAPLTLAIRDLRPGPQLVTFAVDLPENEGALDFEFRAGPTADTGVLSVRAVNGEPPDDDLPTWTLTRRRD